MISDSRGIRLWVDFFLGIIEGLLSSFSASAAVHVLFWLYLPISGFSKKVGYKKHMKTLNEI